MSAVLDRVQSRRRPGFDLVQVRREVLTWFAEQSANGAVVGVLIESGMYDEWGRGVDGRTFWKSFNRLVELIDRHSDLMCGSESARSLYDPLTVPEAREACLAEVEEVLDVLVPKAVT